VRLSNQSKSTPWEAVADTSATGMWTSPKLIAPFQIARAMVQNSLPVNVSLVTLGDLEKFPSGAGWLRLVPGFVQNPRRLVTSSSGHFA
jgi:hypothetical protein